MAIIKSEYPILEFDADSEEILKPNHSMESTRLQEKCVYALLGDTVDAYAEEHGAICVDVLHTITKDYPIYEVQYHGQRITLCQAPLGASAAAQSLDSLIACGVKKIRIHDLRHSAISLLIDMGEGTSYHYLPPSRLVRMDPEIVDVIESVLERKKIPFSECTTWTTDGFFRETRDMVAYRKSEGCSVVEMECAALAACARKRGAQFGQLLFTADTLADPSRYDAREWGASSFEIALSFLFEIAAEM